jgi:hypothetical protein
MKQNTYPFERPFTFLACSAKSRQWFFRSLPAFLLVNLLMIYSSYAQKKTNPVITWPAPAAIVYGTPLSSTQLNASTNVAGTFSYNPAIGTVLNAGTQNLTANFTPANKSIYNSASKTVSIIVSKAAATISINSNSLSQAYTGSPRPVTVSTSPGGVATTVSYTGTNVVYPTSTTAPTNAGSYTVLAKILSTNYTGPDATATLVITAGTKTDPVITWSNPATITFGTALNKKQLNASSNVAGAFVYTPPSGTILNAGTQTLSTKFTPTNTVLYNVVNRSVQIIINKAPASISLNSLSQVYNGLARPAAATTNPANLAYTITYNGSVDAPVNAGSYAVTATITNPNYTGSVNGTLIINKASATLSLSNLNQGYDGAAKPVTVITNPIGLSGVAVTYNGFAAAPTAAGTYAVVASLVNPNYTATNASGNLVISSSPAIIAVGDLSHVYDGTQKTASVTTSPSGLAYTLTYDGSATAPVNAGSYNIVATITEPNYVGSANGILVLNKANATLSLSNLTQVFDGSAKPVTVTTIPAGLSGVSVLYNGSATAPVAVGSYPVVASLNNLNYIALESEGTLNIVGGQATISLSNLSQVYDGTPKTVSATTNPSNLTYTITYNGVSVAPTNAGVYELSATITDPNYTGAVTGTLEITKANATLSLSN